MIMNIILYISILPLQNSIIHSENYYTLKNQTSQTNRPNTSHPKNHAKTEILESYSHAYKICRQNTFYAISWASALWSMQHSLDHFFSLKCNKENQLNIKRLLLVMSNLLRTGTVCLIHQIRVDLEVIMNHILN